MTAGRVVVVGSINMDVVAQTERMPRPGETLVGKTVSLIPGGKGANQAVAARRADVETIMIGALGSDGFAPVLKDFLTGEEVNLDGVSTVEGPTGTAVILVDDGGENSITIVPGANSEVDPASIGSVGLKEQDILLLQDEVPEVVNEQAIAEARRVGATTILNLAPYRTTPESVLRQLDYLVVNETEFSSLYDAGSNPMSSHRISGLLAEGYGLARNVVVTLGAEGLTARVDSSVESVVGYRVPAVVDTTGAGDCFCGAFGAGLARGLGPREALRFANAAAALSVQALGAGPSMPRLHAIEALMNDSV